MTREIDVVDVIRIVNHAVDAAGGEAAFARKACVSRQFIYLVRNGERPPSDSVLAAAGIRRVARYELIVVEGAHVA